MDRLDNLMELVKNTRAKSLNDKRVRTFVCAGSSGSGKSLAAKSMLDCLMTEDLQVMRVASCCAER